MKGITRLPVFRYGSAIVTVFIFLLCHVEISAMILSDLRIPKDVILGKAVRLECFYTLDPNDELYSVKWYKDGNEIYRYLPKKNPPTEALAFSGGRIDDVNSSDTVLIINTVTFSATGEYKCEVSGEKPNFETVEDKRHMRVISEPVEGPKITEGRDKYFEDDMVHKKCISGPSNPAATLAWTIDGRRADSDLTNNQAITQTSTGFQEAVSEIKFKVNVNHFTKEKQSITIKCIASIGSIYSRSVQETVGIERLQISPVQTSTDNRAQGQKKSSNSSSNKNHQYSACVISSLVLIQIFIMNR